jgi:DNA-binding NarL/FixJ family response regulator
VRRRETARGFVGRSAQLGRFRTALGDAADGEPSVLLVTGEAGVGKTRLVEQWLALAETAGATSLVGHCVQFEHAAYPYAPIIEAIRGLLRRRAASEVRDLLGPGATALVALLPELAIGGEATAAADPWGHGPLFEAVLGLLLRLAERADGGIAVAMIEDLHWADAATLDLVNYVVRNLADAPVVIALTTRDELGADPALQRWTAELRRLRAVDTLALASFGRTDTAALVSLRAGHAMPASLVEDIFRRSDGNAFLVEELLDATRSGAPDAPSTLRDTVLGRVGRLSAPARHLVDAVAVGGGRVRLALFEAVVADTQFDALGEAVQATVLVVDADTIRFRHAAFAEAVYDAVLPAERAAWHERFANAITADPDLVGGGAEAQLAAHWLAAGADERALPAVIAAARIAERQHAPAQALAQWDTAMRLAGVNPQVVTVAGLDDVELRAHTAEAANRVGQLDRAVELVREAMSAVDATREPQRAGRLAERLGWYLSRQGDQSGALDAYQVALTLVPELPPSAERARALSAMGRHLTRQGKPADAQRWCQDAVVCAVASAATAEEGFARHALGLTLAEEGRIDEAFDELLAAVRIAESTGDIAELAWTCLHLEKAAADAGRLEDAVDVLLERAELARRQGRQRTYGGLLECIAAGALTELGRWGEADELAAAVEARCPTGVERVAFDLVRGTLDVGRGRFDRAEESLRAAQAVTGGLRDGRVSGLVHDGLAELARWRNLLDAAADVAQEGLDAVANTGDDDMTARLCVTSLRIEADRQERLGGRPGSATARTEVVERCLSTLRRLAAGEGDTTPSRRVVAAAVGAEAVHSRLTGRNEPEVWEAAVEATTRLHSPYDEARARVGLAIALAAAGDREGARRELARAEALARPLGAAPLLEQIDRVAHRANLARPTIRATRREVGDLTARERDVLQLLGAGRTNRQIATTLYISEKTASVHVSRILAKLGVSTRGEASAAARERGLLS